MEGNSGGRDRRKTWQPAPRPEWVARLNDESDVFNMRSAVPLDENSLLAEARKNTGLSDFGDDGWLQHFRVLLNAIEQEAKLNFMGRLLTRCEFINYLEIRLNLQDYFKRFPEIGDEVIKEPVMLLGHGRTGTTILHETLGVDPQFRIVKRWEALYPAPPPEASTYLTDPRIAKADRFITVFDRITPEWKTMHKYGGELPVECAEYLYACFLSNVFVFAFQIPSYAKYVASQDPKYTILWHQRVLKFLQWKYRKEHWLLKNPIWIDLIPQVLDVYPDAKIVLTHRDPVVVADSFVNVMGTIFWWRTDDPWAGGMLDDLVIPELRARAQNNLIKWMQDGTLRPDYVTNVLYQDFVRNPEGTIRKIYADLKLTLTESALGRMLAYLNAKPKGKFGKFEYGRPDDAALATERRVFREYQEYFKVPDEV
jgi:hypothetical protein